MRRVGLVLLCGCGPTVNVLPGEDEGGSTSSDDVMAEVTSEAEVGPSDTAGGPTTVPPPTVDPQTGDPPFETDGLTDCLGGGGPNPLSAPCIFNSECASGVCLTFNDAAPDPGAICAPAPDDCSTVITGTVRSWPDGAASPAGTMRVVKALEALTNPAGATGIVSAAPDGAGRISTMTPGPVSSPIAIVAVVGGAGGDGRFPVGTVIAGEVEAGMYGVGIDVHEFWTIDGPTLTTAQAALILDMSFPGELGNDGGAIGIVRDGAGVPIAGATVEPDAPSSQAVVRYYTATGDVNDDGTDDSGAFVIIGQSPTGEDFTAYVGGGPIATGTVGTANGLLFALALTGG